MATEYTVPTQLANLTDSLESATSSLPDISKILPPEKGVDLLDVKNELFLSYLQTLALRNLAVIRSLSKFTSSRTNDGEEDEQDAQDLNKLLVKKLIEHRVYLEKGVRPLEGRLKYTIDKVVRAAEDEARTSTHRATTKAANNGHANGQETSDRDEDDSGSDAASTTSALAGATPDDLSHRPSARNFARPLMASSSSRAKAATETSDGIYRPPRITPTSLPSTERKEAREVRRPNRSATMDEYINTELSTAPEAMPSIGSTIVDRGRRTKSARERETEADRARYEEENLVRLPVPGKKERAKQGGRGRESGYGGEDFMMLSAGLDRIGRLTKRKGAKEGALERSLKRKAVEDGPRGSGEMGIGGEFEKRKRSMKKRKRG
ncbi:hypothetical protein LTR66_009024 [Elasticomyces elasticus]|nr:hypothetical protein LTR66_009024 [Elasticomyces elasticus]